MHLRTGAASTVRLPLPRAVRCHRRRVVAARAAEVVPDLQALLPLVCGGAPACELYVGSVDEQVQVVRAFYQLAATFDLVHGAPYVLRALLAHDLVAAAGLAHSFDQYEHALRTIHAAIDALPPLLPDMPDA